MRWLTSERGRIVSDADGSTLGRVVDLVVSIDTGEHHPLVTRLLVGRRASLVLIDAHDLERLDDAVIIVTSGTRPTVVHRTHGSIVVREDELLLCRDVLDTQIVDLEGHRVARVADLGLGPRDDGRLRVAGVDVGVGRVLTRLGLHRVGARREDRWIDWDDLHLTSARGHALQLAAPLAAVHRLDAAGLAQLLDRLDVATGTDVLAAIPAERAAAAIVHGRHHTGERLLRALPTRDASHIIRHMPDPHGPDWERRVTRHRPLRGRRFHRFDGWRRHHRTHP